MTGTLNGWPILRSDDALSHTPAWSQQLAQALSDTVGQAPVPPDEVVDTGWVDVPLLNGFVNTDLNRPVQNRRKAGIVYWRGFTTTPSTYVAGSWIKMANYDASAWPATQQPYPLTKSSDAMFQVDFRGNGLYFWSTAKGPHTYVAFTFCYPMD